MIAKLTTNNHDKYKATLTSGQLNHDEIDIISPATTGYYLLYWTRLPSFVSDSFKEVTRVLNNKINVPDTNLGFVETTMGFSATGKVATPSSVEQDKTITIGFNEQDDYPVLNEIENWVNSIRDPHSGLSSVENYNLKNISGDLLVTYIKPILSQAIGEQSNGIITRAILFTNVIPSMIPYSAAFNAEKASNTEVIYDIPFKFRNMISNPSVKAYAEEKLKESLTTSFWKTVSPV
jgi:hypothetical protein